jgi:hypothetical protein
VLQLPNNKKIREFFIGAESEKFALALTAILPILFKNQSAFVFRAMSSEHFGRSVHYEPQQSGEGLGTADSIPEVFAYYLPQFHPTPENSLWHGEGFTEWHKVRAAQPLFYGHYQQHIPHSDLGYYEISDSEILREQTRIMLQGSVDGLIFYHYWFDGKLILEGPSRLLMADQSIEAPFAFCWANENWTRRWDGNNEDVLLAQNYSEEDARAFIRYLLPFFADARYIRRGGRPLLMIYRPEHNPLMSSYVEIWREECSRAGEADPLLVGVMTRGSGAPDIYGFDAGAERPLWDWTQGKVPDIRDELVSWDFIQADILNYREVSEFYSSKPLGASFDLIPGVLPGWDNTARYNKQAHVVHGATPRLFEDWLLASLQKAMGNKPENRFVIVNAWNEWAEGAHLEPDSRFGYAFLNSVARAKSRATNLSTES